ncbi:hypothetical protein AB0K80_01895 [Streptomyces sp. NPDC052682]|uniref:hypothetical protein n=1 Tax=Streptomyces sp. NPDC052682 TaxID=3154954 RepID=UPI0034285FDF
MRSLTVPKPVLMAVFGCLVLSGCGSQTTGGDQRTAGSAVAARTPPDTPMIDDDPELRLLALLNRVTRTCAPDAPSGEGGDAVPEPEDLPGWEGTAPPRYGPGETPPGVPNADGDIPLPLDDPAPSSEPTPDSTGPGPVGEVPLTGVEKCSGREHARRVGEAFGNTRTTGYQALREKLTRLDYPASRIHRMPDRAGAPRVRVDLRMLGSRLALEVTGTGTGVSVEAFAAPETEDVQVTDVQRKPQPAPPTS